MVDAIGFLKNAILDGERKIEYYAKPIKRDLYDALLKKPRMQIICGMRGGGKTTLLFQRFSDFPKGKRIYVSGDELEILGLSLLDLFSNLRYVIDIKAAGVFLDEITKIKDWKEKLKVIYDGYPELSVYASGSSTIELIESKDALARRAKYCNLPPMTFREFMKIAYGVEIKKFNLFAEDVYTEAIRFDIYFKEKMKGDPSTFVENYIGKSQPFMLEAGEDMFMDLMDKVIYEDIAKAYRFDRDVLNKFHRLLLVLSMSEKISYENLSKDLGLSKGIVGEMIRALANSSIIKPVLPYGSARVVGRKTWRYFFIVPAIRMMYMKKGGADNSLIIGLTREDIFVSHLDNVFYLPTGPDFVYSDRIFEVGGRTKGSAQLNVMKTKMPKFVVYDGVDIIKSGNILKIPFYIYLSHL
ncbi:MAG: AAA family ATPase [Candidatus Micrarchaeota archaeon]